MATFDSFDGLTLYYHDEGDGEPVVLLHGFAADTNINWVRSGVFDALLDEGYRVVMLDARGHGLSAKPHEAGAYADDAMTRDVQALLEHLGFGECRVVGYSMGAATAMRLAATDPRVVRAVLLGVGGVTIADDGRDRGAFAAGLLAHDPAEIHDPIAAQFRTLADSVRADRLALAAWASAEHTDVAPLLGEIRVPVLVVAGSDDVLAGSPDDLAGRIPGASAVTVPGDHFTSNAQPALHEAVIAFLAAD